MKYLPTWLLKIMGYQVLESDNFVKFEIWSTNNYLDPRIKLVEPVHVHGTTYRLIWRTNA